MTRSAPPLPRSLVPAALAAALLIPLVAAPAIAAPDPLTATGQDWTVSAVPGGFEVVKELDEPLDVRADVPTLWADGTELGLATESLDGLTLTVTTADPAALEAGSIEQGWAGAGDPEAPAATAPAATTSAVEPAALVPLAADPGVRGPWAVERYDYDLGDEAVALRGFNRQGEIRAAVFLPEATVTGELPVALFLHGRHTSCAGGTRNPLAWPCGPNQTDIPSHLGYNDAAEILASNGYAVVSISANAINALDGSLADDTGAAARGQLVLDHLELLRQADAGTAPAGIDTALTGRLDLDNVGLMGHSRGGEGIMRAAVMNAELDEPFGINGVLPLAPTDYTRITVPGIPTATILPYCDGDVEDQMGQKFINDSRHAYDDDVLRSSVLVMGMNHNYFNTYWTPGKYDIATSDDWAIMDRNQTDPTCGASAPTRASADEQYAFGNSYLAGFFRLTLGGEDEFLPMFDGSDAVPASAGPADVRVSATLPPSARFDIDTFTSPATAVQISGSGTYAICENLKPLAVPSQLPYCVETLGFAQAPDWSTLGSNGKAGSVPSTTAMHLTWTATSGSARPATLSIPIPGGAVDASGYEQLSFRVSPDEHVVGSTELTVTLRDGSGGSASVAASEFGDALTVLPGTADPLRKVLLQQVGVPLTAFTGVDLTDVRQVQLTAPSTAGGVLLSDLALLDAPSLGTAELTTRPLVSVTDLRVEEGAGVGTAVVPVVLSRPAEVTSTAYLTVLGSATGAVGNVMQKVTFAPGDRCVTVPVPVQGNSATSTAARTTFVTNVSLTQQGITIGESFGSIVVREDDGVVDRNGNPLPSAPAVGRQGDACAEALAAEGTLTVTPAGARPGAVVTVTGADFRAGEVVDVALDGVVVDSPVSPDGTFSVEVTLPEDAAYGPHPLTATGAGSGRVATATVQVVTAFADVDPSNQFLEEITWLADRGISTGWVDPVTGEATFRPLEPIARDAMAAFLHRLAGSPEFDAPEVSPFSDVSTDNQFYAEIAWLAAEGVSTGWDDGDGTFSFRPLEPITRDAMAAFLYRTADVEGFEAPSEPPFVDVAAGDAFATEIAWMHAAGISTGWVGNDGRDIYRPLAPVARDAMAAFLFRLDQLPG